MIDTYLKSTDENALVALKEKYLNVLGHTRGRDAVSESVDENGTIIPAQDAAGDPDYSYLCVKADEEIMPFDGVSVCDAETGVEVIGLWA